MVLMQLKKVQPQPFWRFISVAAIALPSGDHSGKIGS